MGKYRNPRFALKPCLRTPHKARYAKAAFAWQIGAKQVKAQGIALYMYRCGCGGWHLTSKADGPGAIKIDTAAAPPSE